MSVSPSKWLYTFDFNGRQMLAHCNIQHDSATPLGGRAVLVRLFTGSKYVGLMYAYCTTPHTVASIRLQ